MDMRDRIKAVATDLFIRSGFRGLSYGDVAAELETTRANLHYHFGSKMRLAEEVLEDNTRFLLGRYRDIWTNEKTTLRQKALASLEFNRERYNVYNVKDEGKPWSLTVRFRLDSDVLSPRILTLMHDVFHQFEVYIDVGVGMAIERGELIADAPRRAIVIQFSAILRYCPFVTQDAGAFQPLEDLYIATLDAIERSYGASAPDPKAGHGRAPRTKRARAPRG